MSKKVQMRPELINYAPLLLKPTEQVVRDTFCPDAEMVILYLYSFQQWKLTLPGLRPCDYGE